MLKVLLKHLIYEKCIDVFFDAVAKNFLSPEDLFRRLGIKISSERILAASRKIKTSWTLEDPVFHNYIPDSITEAMAKSIEAEVDKEILESLYEKAMA